MNEEPRETWLDKLEGAVEDAAEEVIGGSSDEEEEEHVEEADVGIESEQEMCEMDSSGDSGDDVDVDDSGREVFYGRDKMTMWYKKPFRQSVRRGAENVFQKFQKLNSYSRNVQTPLESWRLLFTFIDEIVECTNIYIRTIEDRFKRARDAQATDAVEMNALIGLLYLAGVYKSSHLNVRDLWARDGTGLEIFYSTMSYNRFLFLMRCIRFDNVLTRKDRLQTDKLAAIRKIYEEFNDNIRKSYNVGDLVLSLIQPHIDRRSKIKTHLTSLQRSCKKFASKEE
ncbi:hypothetical protein J437_LFUL014577 [Ladona fulva]|uniref:PiggyBac transposable element-derived protein domain-containing protein n=1 Tax=Ladona fulva TaxID=123851 RepID=A0A8K0NUD3_LADFU|nr:hypothetical protein J437_LFUL014577 [Ladona fulva]